MKRTLWHRLRLITLLCAVGLILSFLGPVAIRLVTDAAVAFRAMRDLALSEKHRKEHPVEPTLISREPDVILRTAAATSVRVYRLDPLPDSSCNGKQTEGCLGGHRVLGRIPVQGMDWGRRFLAVVVRMATVNSDSSRLEPRFGIRFMHARDTTEVLLDTTDSPRDARVVIQWRGLSARPQRAVAHMLYPFEGDPDADSTLQHLKRLPLGH